MSEAPVDFSVFEATNRAVLVGLFCETLLFGAFGILYGIAMWILLRNVKQRSRGLSTRNLVLALAATLLFVLSLVHVATGTQRAIGGFIGQGAQGPIGIFTYLVKLNAPGLILQNVINTTVILIADGFLTYRLYIVWGGNRLVAAGPLMIFIATAVTGYAVCIVQTTSTLSDGGSLKYWIEGMYSLTLIGNILSTALISVKIVWANYQLRKANTAVFGVSVSAVVDAICQSALVYSVNVVCQLGTYISGSNGWFVCLLINPPLIGIVFTVIIIRVRLQTTTIRDELSTLTTFDALAGKSNTGDPQGGEEYSMRPMGINVSVAREAHSDALPTKGMESYGCAASVGSLSEAVNRAESRDFERNGGSF